MNAHRVAALVVAVALLAGACGDDGRLNHAEYTHEVGKVCRRANAALDDVELRRLNGPKAAHAVDELVAIGRDELDELHSTEPPKNGEHKVDEWLATLEQVLNEGDYASSLLRKGDRAAAVEAARRAGVLAERAHALARTFGVPDACRVPNLVHPG